MDTVCKISGERFSLLPGELELLDRLSPIIGGKRYPLPAPTVHPVERMRRRLAFRNLRRLYRRKCDFSGREIITMYRPTSTMKVYHSDHWWSDQWDPLEYGRDVDFSRPFLEQVRELYHTVPTIHLYAVLNENCDYVNGVATSKDCYLVFNVDRSESCYYINDSSYCRSCCDILSCVRCELCVECIDCEGCYGTAYSERSANCVDSLFLADCRRCRNCIGCVNLVDKENYILNRPATAEEVAKLKQSLRSRSAVSRFRAKFKDLVQAAPRRAYTGTQNEGSSGEAIRNTKNAQWCFDSFELEDCYYCTYLFNAKNCMDVTIFGDNSELLYQCLATGLNCTHNICCIGCWSGSSENLYSILVSGCTACFGCVSLKSQSHCILNKRYSPAEYERLAGKIIEHMKETGEWGEFFPPGMSPFSFLETEGYGWYPLSADELVRRGYRTEPLDPVRVVDDGARAPDRLEEIDDSCTGKIFRCAESGQGYRYLAQELRIHHLTGTPLSDMAPEFRYWALLANRNPRVLWTRECAKCHSRLLTSFSAHGAEVTVNCDKCYRSDFY